MAYNPLRTPIDVILLGNPGEISPGIAKVKANAPRKWQEQSGYAMAGSFLIGGGRGLAHPEISIRLSTEEDWDQWADWSRLLKRPPGNKLQRSLDIWHPWLAEADIKSVVIEDVIEPEEADETGGYIYVIKTIEFRRPSFSLSKPDASAAPQDTDPVELQIAALTKQYQDLANK